MIQPVNSSSVPVVGGAGQPVRGQATEKPVQSAQKTGTELPNPKEWLGGGGAGDEVRSKVARDELFKVVDEANKSMANLQSDLSFSVDEETGRFIVKVVDSKTKEVISQLPTKEMLELAKALKSLTSGLFLNEKV